MNYFLLLCVVFGVFTQNIEDKRFSIETSSSNSIFIYNLFGSGIGIILLCVAGFFKGEFNSFHLQSVQYGVLFGIFYFMASYGIIMAIRMGSLALTSLVISFSPLIPAAVGMLFLKDGFKITKGIGLMLLIICLLLLKGKSEKALFTVKWLLWMVTAFISNGLCSVMQVIHQTHYPCNYRYLFLTSGFCLFFLINLICFLFQKNCTEKNVLSAVIKHGVPKGIANVAVNILTITLAGEIASSVMYPTISAGGIIFTFAASLLIFKEKFERKQIIAFLIGIMSALTINL